MFVGLAFPALLASALLLARGASASSLALSAKSFDALLMQLVWYVSDLRRACWCCFRVRYDRPFWRSLGWRFPFRGQCSLLASRARSGDRRWALIGYVIHTPAIKLPMFDQMLVEPADHAFCSRLFVVVLGPLCEELAFRGFLHAAADAVVGRGGRHRAHWPSCSARCMATNTNGPGGTCC